MEHLLTFFKQIAETYGMTTAIACLLLGGVFFGIHTLIKASPTLIEKYIDRRETQQAQEHVKANLKRKNIAAEVSRTLSDLIVNTKINRAILFEFSNGSSNLAGLPFLFVNATCECFAVGSTSIAYAYQRVNVSLFADFLLEVENIGYIYIGHSEDIRLTFPAIYNLLKQHTCGSAVFYAIYGVDQLLGVLLLTVKEGHIFSVDDVIANIAEASQKISGLLCLENWEELVN